MTSISWNMHYCACNCDHKNTVMKLNHQFYQKYSRLSSRFFSRLVFNKTDLILSYDVTYKFYVFAYLAAMLFLDSTSTSSKHFYLQFNEYWCITLIIQKQLHYKTLNDLYCGFKPFKEATLKHIFSSEM